MQSRTDVTDSGFFSIHDDVLQKVVKIISSGVSVLGPLSCFVLDRGNFAAARWGSVLSEISHLFHNKAAGLLITNLFCSPGTAESIHITQRSAVTDWPIKSFRKTLKSTAPCERSPLLAASWPLFHPGCLFLWRENRGFRCRVCGCDSPYWRGCSQHNGPPRSLTPKICPWQIVPPARRVGSLCFVQMRFSSCSSVSNASMHSLKGMAAHTGLGHQVSFSKFLQV